MRTELGTAGAAFGIADMVDMVDRTEGDRPYTMFLPTNQVGDWAGSIRAFRAGQVGREGAGQQAGRGGLYRQRELDSAPQAVGARHSSSCAP